MTIDQLNNSDSSFQEEKQLWQAFKKGDLKAYEQLFNLFYQDLYGYGLQLCAQTELVRDSIQALFVTLWDRKEYLDEVRSVKAYLLASLRRKILKTLRQERKISPLDFFAEEPAASVQISIEESIIQGELEENQKQILLNALEDLPERQKEVLFLKYYNGMSYEEIEEILSINYQSIRNHIYRALERLRTSFEDQTATPVLSVFIQVLPALWFFIS
ncbi:RNA polymerase sigma factor [Rhodohalobacter sp. 614A]|uniref:RNA polymerase sigma factor n=1 Tax=Rhodohalobacter sp. 614A TaxID=2908649 RepID=UPI001F378713|nr:sigma-70 family RNA polymerase sigma factor [Rhodohalobacter sp. 614A]